MEVTYDLIEVKNDAPELVIDILTFHYELYYFFSHSEAS